MSETLKARFIKTAPIKFKPKEDKKKDPRVIMKAKAPGENSNIGRASYISAGSKPYIVDKKAKAPEEAVDNKACACEDQV